MENENAIRALLMNGCSGISCFNCPLRVHIDGYTDLPGCREADLTDIAQRLNDLIRDDLNHQPKDEDENRDSSPVNHPTHYNHGGVETIDLIKCLLTPIEYVGFLKGNIIKYRDRQQYKGKPEEDGEKMRWYMHRYEEGE